MKSQGGWHVTGVAGISDLPKQGWRTHFEMDE